MVWTRTAATVRLDGWEARAARRWTRASVEKGRAMLSMQSASTLGQGRSIVSAFRASRQLTRGTLALTSTSVPHDRAGMLAGARTSCPATCASAILGMWV